MDCTPARSGAVGFVLLMPCTNSPHPEVRASEVSEPRRTHLPDAARYPFRNNPSRFAAIRSSQRAGSISGRSQFISGDGVMA